MVVYMEPLRSIGFSGHVGPEDRVGTQEIPLKYISIQALGFGVEGFRGSGVLEFWV